MKRTTTSVLFTLLLLVSATVSADLGDATPKVKVLKTEGRIDSKTTPNSWKALTEVLKHGHAHPCSKMKPFHRLFDRMHRYGEKHYDEHIPKEGIVGYKLWYDLKEGKGKFSAEREWDFKVIFCDYDR